MAAVAGDFFTDLAIVLMVAAVALLLVRMLRQPLILGYLVAGVLVGPHGPFGVEFVSLASVETLAQLGILFIMVSLGLEFNPRRLRRIGAVAFAVATLQVLVSFGIGQLIATRLLDLDRLASAFFGGALAISSTIVAFKALEPDNGLDTAHGRLAIGVLLIQDVVAVAFLGVFGGLEVSGELAVGEATSILFGLVVFALAALVVGALFAPRFLHFAARASEELLLIVLLGLVFGVSLLAVHFGFSIALGAFIVGAIVAETRIVHTAERLVGPLRDMFTAVFFVSVGMLIVPGQVIADWRLVLLLSAVVVATRFLLVPLPAFLFGTPMRTGLRSGAAISQVGEFSFIIIGAGTAAGALEARWLAVFTGVAALTTLLTPYLIRAAPSFLRLSAKVVPAPLRTFGDLYAAWVERLGEAEETELHRSREVALLRRILLNLVALTVVGSITYLAQTSFSETSFMVEGRAFLVMWFVWPVVAVVAFPFVITVWRSLRELAVEVVMELVPDRMAHGQGEAPMPLKIVRASLGLVLALGLGALLVVFLPDLGPRGGPVLLVMLGVVALMAALLWRRIRNLHGHVEHTITGLFGEHKPRKEVDRDEVLRLIGIHYSISLATETMVVSGRSTLAHHQIRDAQLRSRTGATIVSLERGDDRLVNPPPSTLILPGDALLLMGEPHHLEKARALIMVPDDDGDGGRLDARKEPVRVREITLPATSPSVGLSIAHLDLRSRTGVSLVAAIRGSEHIQNPAPGFALQPGDRLFLFGTLGQLDGAEALLLTGDPNPEGRLDRFRDQVGSVAGLDLPETAPGEKEADSDGREPRHGRTSES